MCESTYLHHGQMPPSPSPPRPPEYKHFCRVCNKGFTCGSALGGHMRAHSASDVDGFGADDDSPRDEPPVRSRGSDDQWDAPGTSATHAYALRANPNRLIRSCQVCKNCGKEFTSWELFLEHGRCNSDEEDDEADGSLRSSSPPSDADSEEDPAVGAGWSKGKRSRRVKLMTAGDDPLPTDPSRRCASGEEEDLANCLVMLSSSNNIEHATVARTDQKDPCTSASKEGGRRPPLLQPISFLAPASEPVMALPSEVAAMQYVSPAPRGVFECKACKKVFTSHQALGGHRASHKKVKGCFAAKIESSASEQPSYAHAASPSTNNDNGKATAVDVNANGSADVRTNIYNTIDGDTDVGTSEAAASVSMALVPIVHEPPVALLTVATPCKKNAKMHECSVCHRLFTSGQALGGHKRCHWLASSTADPTNPVAHLTVPPLTEDIAGVVRHQLILRPSGDAPDPALDLTIAANPLPLTAPVVRAEAGSSSFHLDVAAPVHFQSPVVPSKASHRSKISSTSGHDAATASAAAEDEADSTTAKKARLSDLKDVVSMDGEPTEPWLQVGIGSSSAGGGDRSTRQ
ncbi:uncharacterized protein LOC133889316 [Phragmites australis]|uniref:uncharacterized protein LOC133889316 n=1 Tax=Phragmites australis TaxID=29695 RepID=UPI002D780A05|nr:uncharacterized protein LOC133889316 [Phragmites australis]